MLRNYITIAFRNLVKNRVFSIINISGLGLGIAAFVFILQYISFEQSVNLFHTNGKNVYRVLFENSLSAKRETWESTTSGLAPRLKENFSEVKNFCRVMESSTAAGIINRTNEANGQILPPFREKRLGYAETSFFEIFSFPLLQGTKNCLETPNSAAISETYAKKYFSNENAIGKTLVLNNQFGKTIYTITGIFKDFPTNSDLQYDLLFSLETLKNPANLNGNSWVEIDGLDNQFITSYFLVQTGTDYSKLEQKFNDFKKKLRPEATEILRLQPLTNIHLGQSLSDYYLTSGNLTFVYLMSGVAVLILFIAWFNYINLSTAGSLKRAKEVGVRKVIGASRGQLIGQFLGESLLLNLCGLVLAIILVAVLQPIFNKLINKPLSLSIFKESRFWVFGLLLLIVGSLASGAYTAFALSSFKPTQTLKGVFAKSGKGILLRKFLVVFQFSISIMLLAGTMVLFQQLRFMQNKNLGMNIQQVLVIKGAEVDKDSTFKQRNSVFLNDLTALPYVKQISNTGTVPGNYYNWGTVGITRLNPQPGEEKKSYNIALVDENYFKTFGIELLAGQNFTSQMCEVKWNDMDKLIINEKTALSLGFNTPQAALGQKIKWGAEREIIAIVKDYHHQGLKQTIEPVVFMPRHNGSYYALRLTTEQVQSKMGDLEKLFKQNFPGNPYEYFFADENYNKQYNTEIQYGNIFTIASFLAIFIGCLGLFGLAHFSVEQKTKEIGIRKVLGASVSQIVTLLSKDFLKLVLIAFVTAVPVAWYAMNKWIQDFAYRIDISWWIFALAGILALLIALFTVSFQAIRAALANPVKSLRTE